MGHREINPNMGNNIMGSKEKELVEMNQDFIEDQVERILISDVKDDRNIVIWHEDDLVFISIGNTTIGLSEADFYALTKLTQIATKKLLKLEE